MMFGEFVGVMITIILVIYMTYHLIEIIGLFIFCRTYGVSFSEAWRRLQKVKRR